ncbi:MAG: response regulator [Deltaproteobacteria bacterium]|nr:response regulator [Deltaproteobacteria bacterium]
MRVLLVDDEVELVSTLSERLSLRGIHSDWASSAEDAIQKLDKGQYDVAVLDVKIPRTSGIELKKRMEEKHPGMRFIFITGHGSEQDFQAGSAEAGPEYYLVKPVNIEDLIKKMEDIMENEGGSD